MIGSRVGPYEITAKLGEGGMGEVYQAKDFHLGRNVALKVLPEGFTQDAERLARFEREAKLLAQLNHPNIAQIYGFETSGDTRALVMELVDGPTLAERLEQGPLPFNESLSVSLQIAHALEEAHEKGIVHRDLKPQNIKASIEGKVKVLDFGLAKAMDPAGTTSGSASKSQLAQSPTLTLGATVQGMILGTAAYMAPEQARGVAVDKRADIWAFGVVLYEMLSGRRLFEGELVTDVLANVLKKEVDLDALPAEVPTAIRSVLRRCLERNPKNRLHDIADARIVIDEVVSGRTEPDAVPRLAGAARSRVPWIVAAASVISAVVAVTAILLARPAHRPGSDAQKVLRAHFVPPNGERLGFGVGRVFAISPDGSKLVYAVESAPTSELRVRSLDSGVSTAIPGTEGATNPFFSPDGRWVAFAAGSKLKKVALAGGMPVAIADAPVFRGGVWGDDGSIYFVPSLNVPIARISAGGGAVEPVTRIRSEEGELQHRWPDLLPGAKVILYAVGYGEEWDRAAIVAERLDTGERKIVVKGGSSPRFLPGDVLVYARAGGLYAVAFDPRSLQVTGAPAEVAANVTLDLYGSAQADFSRSGLLVTVPADSVAAESRLAWIDRAGQGQPLRLPLGNYVQAKLSPAGDRVALSIGNGLSILDLERLSLSKLTLARRAEQPVWSPDGRRLYFGYEEGKSYQIFTKAADDSGAPQLAIPSDSQNDPYAISRDGSRLLSQLVRASGTSAIVIHDLRDPKSAAKVLFSSADLSASNLDFSPDGRWVVYNSEESGRPEIYVRPASGEERKWQVSVDGGKSPVWSRAGDEIFFLCGAKMMAAPVSARGDELVVGEPKILFANHRILAFDVSRDGRRFLVAEDPNPEAQSRLDLVVNWFAEIQRKVAEAHTP